MAEVIFLLDEAAALGQMDAIDNALNVGRGYGLRLILIYQSAAQLKKCFPEGQDGNIQANTTAIYFAVNDPVTAEEVSKRLGDFSEIVTSGGTSSGGSRQKNNDGAGGSFSHSVNSNSNWNQVARRLLKPEEVCALHPRVAITFTPGVPPVWSLLLKYYEEPRLAQPPGWCSRLMTAVKTFALSVLFAGLSAMLVFAVIDAQLNRGSLPR
ncbi:MAG: TraM recognition domain-containing protein [Planctomycetes bacterium]|nr:TraM recognition domain-containing protein [Planctomycetota bacterium]